MANQVHLVLEFVVGVIEAESAKASVPVMVSKDTWHLALQ